MKNLLFLLLSLLSIGQITAKCANSGFNVFPMGSSISANSYIVLEGYAASQEIIIALNKEYPIYLLSGNEKIKLNIQEIKEGAFRLSQAVLIPEKALTEGKTYTLHIDKLPEGERLDRYNAESGDFEKISWTVTVADKEQPIMNTKISELDKSYELFGCGPSVYVTFDCNATDNNALLAKTTLKNLKSGKTQTYYLAVENGKIQVGHGMCSGAFSFDEDGNYEVSFEIMDAAGNIAENSKQTLTLVPPKS